MPVTTVAVFQCEICGEFKLQAHWRLAYGKFMKDGDKNIPGFSHGLFGAFCNCDDHWNTYKIIHIFDCDLE